MNLIACLLVYCFKFYPEDQGCFMQSKITQNQWQSVSGLDLTQFQPIDVFGVAPSDTTLQEGFLYFVSDKKNLPTSRPPQSTWVLDRKLKNEALVENLQSPGLSIVWTDHIGWAMSQLLSFFDPRLGVDLQDFVQHQGAWVHRTAQLGQGVRLFPGVVVGAHAKIGNNSELRSHVVIEPYCEVGQDNLIHGGTVIGSDGFGFYKDTKGSQTYKIPQIGHVITESQVEIGANCTIDRATLTHTRIGFATKLDNLVHFAHNTVVGQFGFFAAGFMCAGSMTIGDHFACGGDVVVSDHINICDHVTIGGRSGVTKDITVPGFYVGYPLEPWKEGLRTMSLLPNLSQMRRDLSDLKKQFNKGLSS